MDPRAVSEFRSILLFPSLVRSRWLQRGPATRCTGRVAKQYMISRLVAAFSHHSATDSRIGTLKIAEHNAGR